MMGFPFETTENMQNTLDFIKLLKPDIFNINRFYPFPKTPIVKEYNLKTIENYVYRTNKMTKESEKLLSSAYLHFFSNPYNLKNIIKKVGMYSFCYSLFKLFKASIHNRLKNFDYFR